MKFLKNHCLNEISDFKNCGQPCTLPEFFLSSHLLELQRTHQALAYSVMCRLLCTREMSWFVIYLINVNYTSYSYTSYESTWTSPLTHKLLARKTTHLGIKCGMKTQQMTENKNDSE